jgi:flagellar hook-associated protein 1 FlgK
VSFVTLHTGLSGLRAAQTAIDTTSHNIANVNTRGYTRQRVETQARLPYDSPVGQVGTGVEVDSIVRLRDTFLDTRVRTTAASFTRSDARAALLGRLEQVYAEPDNGISTELDELWAAFEDLSLDPDSQAVRVAALSQLEQVAARVRDVATGINELETGTETNRDAMIAEAQDLLQSVADINRQVTDTPRDEPNLDLLDQRDVQLDRLAGLLGSDVTLETNGSVTVRVGGQTLVSGTTPATLAIAAGQLTVDGNAVAIADTRGELGGTLDVLANDIPTARVELDDVVTRLSQALNNQHGLGFTDAGVAGGPLVAYTPGTLTSFQVALTAPADMALKGAAGTGVNDNRNAIALADLRTTPRGDGLTHESALRRTVIGLGARVAAAERNALAAADIATSAEVARQSQHGVSLDEEMVGLVQYQRAMEASSRIMTAADEMLDTIINRMGVVGR